MKLVQKKLDESRLCHSAPGIPDVRRISCTELAGSLASFCERYLGGAAEVTGPAAKDGEIAISPSALGRALRKTVDALALGEPVRIVFAESMDELCVRIEAAGAADSEPALTVIEAWRAAGFKLRRIGLSITLSISYADGLAFVARESDLALIEKLIYGGYFANL